ncbi:hypothetical protein F3Y22_tig00111023pilonHSYRG00039 [Hibiscus syriacus]|uniref:Reverse transcriptase Ty1/copia-type domain-containing protein n=1 Tax=Hibiscus syriacus TaxID=106335 RepID=A0A6A2Z6L0_HIBSY|nr:hypothetical protein F3Y22_tig00111023pilonHSYRG00039 [Hibiscus syriacus]
MFKSILKQFKKKQTHQNLDVPPEFLNQPALLPSLHYLLLTDNGEPECYDEAMQVEDSVKWESSMKDEMDSLTSNQTRELVELSPGNKVLHNKWIYRIKEEHDGANATKQDWLSKVFSKKNLDVKTTFLHSDLEEEIYMRQQKASLRHARKTWFDNIFIILLLYVDDMLVAGSDMQEIIHLKFNMQDAKLVSTPLGVHFTLSKEHSPKTEEERAHMVKVSYASAIGSLMYPWFVPNQILLMQYLRGTTNKALCFKGGDTILTGYADADLAEMLTSERALHVKDLQQSGDVKKLVELRYQFRAKIQYNNSFSEKERRSIKSMIQSNLYSYLAILLQGREQFEEEILMEDRKRQIADGSGSIQHNPSAGLQPILKLFNKFLGIDIQHVPLYQLIRLHHSSLGEKCKWLEMFEEDDFVLFSVSLTDYDEFSLDSNGVLTNKMLASKQLFESIVTHPTFEKKNFLLLLKKDDLLEEKIEQIPLTRCEWSHDFNPVIVHNQYNNCSCIRNNHTSLSQGAFQYIATKFKRLFNSLTDRNLYVSTVTCLETDSVDEALRYSRHILKWNEPKIV